MGDHENLTKKRDPRFQKVEGTAWTVDVDGEIQWQLRYGDPASVRMLAASLAEQFARLADPSRPLKDCQNALRRARHAVANAHAEVHLYDYPRPPSDRRLADDTAPSEPKKGRDE
jgi:hypothetical protein